MARPRQVTDEAILEAVRGCVYEQGPAVSTTVIAQAVGVSQATLFKRFGTKEDLLLAALLPTDDIELAWMPRLERGPSPGPLEPQFREMVLALVTFFDQMFPRLSALKNACLMEHAMARMASHGQDAPPIRGRRAVSFWLTQAQASGRLGEFNTRLAAIALIGAAQGLASRNHMLKDALDTSAETYAEELATMIWRGLAPREAAQ